MAHTTGAANAWSVIAADSARDLVFVPTGSASPDYYGGERVGDNRYANSIVALRASTGKIVWHFQTVHHDLWDYDNASPPALATITHDGKPRRRRAPGDEDRPALRARSRHGQAGLPGRGARRAREHRLRRARVGHAAVQHGDSGAQPAALLARQRVGSDARPIASAASQQIRPLRNEGVFTPPSLQGTLVHAVEHRRRALGRPGLRSRAADRRSFPSIAIAAFVQLIRLDELDTAAAMTNSHAARRSVHSHARHALRHAPAHAHRPERTSVRASALGRARRRST